MMDPEPNEVHACGLKRRDEDRQRQQHDVVGSAYAWVAISYPPELRGEGLCSEVTSVAQLTLSAIIFVCFSGIRVPPRKKENCVFTLHISRSCAVLTQLLSIVPSGQRFGSENNFPMLGPKIQTFRG